MRVRHARQIDALASPMRLAIVSALESSAPCSVAALARQLGVAPDGLYYHLRLLARRGLVRKEGEIVTASQVRLVYDAADARNRAAVTRVAGSVLRAALRAFTAAFRRPGVRVRGKRRELWFGHRTARLTAAQLERVNALLEQLLQTFEEARTSAAEDEPVYVVTFALSPR